MGDIYDCAVTIFFLDMVFESLRLPFKDDESVPLTVAQSLRIMVSSHECLASNYKDYGQADNIRASIILHDRRQIPLLGHENMLHYKDICYGNGSTGILLFEENSPLTITKSADEKSGEPTKETVKPSSSDDAVCSDQTSAHAVPDLENENSKGCRDKTIELNEELPRSISTALSPEDGESASTDDNHENGAEQSSEEELQQPNQEQMATPRGSGSISSKRRVPYVSDLHRFSGCERNPGHERFIPIKELSIHHLPEGLQIPELITLIKLKGHETVRLIVKKSSRERPIALDTTQPTNEVMFATGTALLPQMGEPEPCSCDQIEGDHSISGSFILMTSAHVISDDEEARNTTIEFFYDSEDRGDVVLAQGRRVIEAAGNRVLIECKTHDLSLINKLKDNLIKREELIANRLEPRMNGSQIVVVIAHPHGASKHISVGILQEITKGDIRKNEDGHGICNCILKYDTPTCSGSEGAPVNVFGGSTTVAAFAPHFSFIHGEGNTSGLGSTWANAGPY